MKTSCQEPQFVPSIINIVLELESQKARSAAANAACSIMHENRVATKM